MAHFRARRKTRRMAESVILAGYQWWKGYHADQVVEGLRAYIEKAYATEGKDEKYARGIIRNSRPADPKDPDYPPLRSFS